MKKTVLSFLFLGAVLSAAPVHVSLLNAGNGAVDANGQYYVGPYTLTINGVATPAMCMDDFIDNNIGDSWRAHETKANASDFSHTYLGNGGETVEGISFSSGQIYGAEAYLFSLITKPGADQADIQEAAWVIMDPNNPAYIGLSGVQNYLLAAYFNSPGFDASGYTIVSDVEKGCKQEFMVASAPEPASFLLFGSGIFAAGAARFFRRKQVKA